MRTNQQLITACGFLYDDTADSVRLFLPKRSASKTFLPGIYELPGGHVEYGEDLYRALHREFSEEFGVDIQIGDPFAAFTYQNESRGSHSIEVVCFARLSPSSPTIRLSPDDHSTYCWATRSKLDDITAGRPTDDPEIQAMVRGFEILTTGFTPKFR